MRCKNKDCRRRGCIHESMSTKQALGTLQGWMMYELDCVDEERLSQTEICEWKRRCTAYNIIERILNENGLCE